MSAADGKGLGSEYQFFPPGKFPMSRGAMRRMGLIAKIDQREDKDSFIGGRMLDRRGNYHVCPECFTKDAIYDRVNRQYTRAFSQAYLSCEPIPHPLAGEPSATGEGQEDKSWHIGTLFFNTAGLYAFPLSSRMVNFAFYQEGARLRFIAFIIRLKLEALGSKLASRAAALAALLLLSSLHPGRVAASTAQDHAAEPPPLRPPRAPGVDPFGLFAPLC